jgi:mercuric ion transport protein
MIFLSSSHYGPMETPTSKLSITAGVLAAIGASVCCVGPLVLLGLGVSGAWIANLTALEPFRPLLIGVTAVFLVLAYRRLYRAAQVCAPGTACANTTVLRRQRITFWTVSVLVLALLAFPWIAPAFL